MKWGYDGEAHESDIPCLAPVIRPLVVSELSVRCLNIGGNRFTRHSHVLHQDKISLSEVHSGHFEIQGAARESSNISQCWPSEPHLQLTVCGVE